MEDKHKCKICSKYHSFDLPSVAEFIYTTPNAEEITVDVVLRNKRTRDLAFVCPDCYGTVLVNCAGMIAMKTSNEEA